MSTKNPGDERKDYERTTAGLRELLFDTIVDLRAGKVSSGDAKAVAALSREMILTVDMELKVQSQAREMDPGNETAFTLAPPTIKLLPTAP